MATTPNYGWVTPAPTDFVTDLPADFETFADAVDASFAAVEGDLLVGGTSNIFEPLPIGALGTVLTSDGTTAEWAAPSAGGDSWTLLTTVTPTSVTDVDFTSLSGYENYVLQYNSVTFAAFGADIGIQINGVTSSNYANLRVSLNYPQGGGITSNRWFINYTSSVNPTHGFFHFTGGSVTGVKRMVGSAVGPNTGDSARENVHINGFLNTSSGPISSIKFYSSQNVTGGTFRLWGA